MKTSTFKPVRFQVSTLIAVVPSDSTPIKHEDDAFVLYVTTPGTVRILTVDNNDISFPVVNPGWQSVLVKKVFATGTTGGLTILAGK